MKEFDKLLLELKSSEEVIITNITAEYNSDGLHEKTGYKFNIKIQRTEEISIEYEIKIIDKEDEFSATQELKFISEHLKFRRSIPKRNEPERH